jgi:hypothetical protein
MPFLRVTLQLVCRMNGSGYTEMEEHGEADSDSEHLYSGISKHGVAFVFLHCSALAAIRKTRSIQSMLYRLFLLYVAVASAPSWAADRAVIVRAKGRGVPLSRVEVKAGASRVFTDPDGKAHIDVPDGDGKLELYRGGYERLEIPFEELKSAETSEFFLIPAVPDDEEVRIIGIRRPEASRKRISIEEAVKVAPGGDPVQVTKLLPGVQANSFQPTIVVRGSAPDDSLYRIDDWTLPYVFHSIGNISIIPDRLLSDVEFSAGGFGSQYGGASGGVINIRTKSDIPERPLTEFRANVPIYSGFYHERPVEDGKARFAMSARRSYLEYILPPILSKANKSGQSLTVVPYFGDAHFFYNKPLEDGQIKVLGLYSFDGLRLAIPSQSSDNENGRGSFSLRDRVCLLGLEWTKALSPDWVLRMMPNLNDVDRKFDVIGNKIYVGATNLSLQAEAMRRLGGKDRLYIGTEEVLIWGHAEVFAPKVDFDDPFVDPEDAPKIGAKVKEQYVNSAVWIGVDKEIGDLMFTPGLRSFYSTQNKRAGADPRLNIRYKLDQQNSLKGAAGQYSQLPQFRDLSDDFGNPNLKYIRSNHFILGIETAWSDKWNTDFQGFYKETSGLVKSDPVTNTNNAGSRLTFGGEAFVRRNLTQRLFGWLSYTWSKNLERDNDSETFRRAQYDQTHVINLVGNYKFNAVWDAGGRALYRSGDTFTTVDDAVYNANLDKYQQRRSPDSRLYNGRLPASHELNLYGNRQFLFDKWTMSLRFGVELLALRPQVRNVRYNYDYSKKEYFTGIPPVPYIEVRAVL